MAGGNNRHDIRKIVISTGAVSVVAGNGEIPGTALGTGSDAQFDDPRKLVFSPIGDTLYIADFNNRRILQIQ